MDPGTQDDAAGTGAPSGKYHAAAGESQGAQIGDGGLLAKKPGDPHGFGKPGNSLLQPGPHNRGRSVPSEPMPRRDPSTHAAAAAVTVFVIAWSRITVVSRDSP